MSEKPISASEQGFTAGGPKGQSSAIARMAQPDPNALPSSSGLTGPPASFSDSLFGTAVLQLVEFPVEAPLIQQRIMLSLLHYPAAG